MTYVYMSVFLLITGDTQLSFMARFVGDGFVLAYSTSVIEIARAEAIIKTLDTIIHTSSSHLQDPLLAPNLWCTEELERKSGNQKVNMHMQVSQI